MLPSRSLVAWAAVLVPVWVVLVLGTYWEPVVRDSWVHVWRHHATTIDLVDFAKDTYLHNNPRIGQVVTLLLLTPGPWHVIVTPLVELAMVYLLAALVLGRWPSVRRSDDALVVATLVAMLLVTCPMVGPMLFYRPFTGNYLYGFVLNLLLLVPYRLHLESPLAGRAWLAPVMLVAGIAAGLSNEHTDPALAALCMLAIVVAWRRQQLRPWMIVGLVGLLAGSAALFFAPGQNLRYDGLATQQSLMQRITARGAGNVDIVVALLRYVRLLAVWLALAAAAGFAARRRIPMMTWVFAATSLVVTLTLLASPKLGPRLYLASVSFACAAVACVVIAQLQATWSRAVAWTLAAALTVLVAVRLVAVYASVGPVARERVAKILAAPQGSTLQLPVLPAPRSRYFIGDDLVYDKWRAYVAESFGLAAIELTDQRRAIEPADDDP